MLTAWSAEPQGPAWAPWAWSLVYGTGIGLVVWLAAWPYVPTRMHAPAQWVLSGLCITLANHALFKATRRLVRRDGVTLPLALRIPYVCTTSVVASTIGYAIAKLIELRGDGRALVEHLSQAAGFLVGTTVFWSAGTILVMALVSRLREAQLQRERERAAQADAARQGIEARLQLLNAQIEPHFLYNSLAHVRALIGEDPAAARDMLDALVEWLRGASRNMSRALVPLADELASVRGYLAVMQRRMGPRLAVRFDVDPALDAVPIPPASIQPLVENAIKHGLEPVRAGGEIAVVVRRDGGAIVVQVRDTGAGFGATASGPVAGGTGLANLRERLRLAFGERATLALESPATGGAVATLRIAADAGPAAGTAAGTAHEAHEARDDARQRAAGATRTHA